jgi:hypothetical protein
MPTASIATSTPSPSSDRPDPDHRDRVAGLDVAVEHADLVAGRQDVGEEQHLLIGHARGHLDQAGPGERDSRVLGLQPVDQVAEDPADAADLLAMRRHAPGAVAATAAVGDRRDDHLVARRQPGHGGAEFGDRADRLVAENPSVRDGWHVALEDVQVRAADGRGVDPDDRIGGVLDGRIGDLFPRLGGGTVVDQCLHRCLLW